MSPSWGADQPGTLNVLEGGAGDDEMRGDMGRDLFVFGTASGHDTIDRFDPAKDLIVIEANVNGSGIRSFAGLQGRISESSGDALIDLGAGNGILVDDVPAAALSPANVLFVEMTATGFSFV